MNERELTFFLLSQFVMQAPMLLVYFSTLVVAALYMRRAPLPASLALFGALILLATSLAFPLLQWFMIHQSTSNFATMSRFLALASNCLRAVGTALLVWAIFAGRLPTAAHAAAIKH